MLVYTIFNLQLALGVPEFEKPGVFGRFQQRFLSSGENVEVVTYKKNLIQVVL